MPRRDSSTRSALLAVAALRPPPRGEAGPPLVAALRRHRLAPLGSVVLARAGQPAAELLRPDLDAAVSTHLRALASLADLAAALGDLPWAVLKGPVLSELAHPVPGARGYSDVDVLVRPADLRRAVAALRAQGWVLLDRSHRLVLARMPGELHLLGPHGVSVDLHWSLVNDAAVRRRLDLPADALLQRRVERTLSAGPVPCLDDVDALLHLCLHAALAGADRLLWLVDLDAWVRATTVDWAALAGRAHRSGTAVATALCLRRARAALGTPVPAGLDRALVPAGWWHLAAGATDRAQPVAALAADRSFARLFARACRQTAGASAAELARRAPRALSRRGPAPERHSVAQDRPDERAWQAYLSAVEGSAGEGSAYGSSAGGAPAGGSSAGGGPAVEGLGLGRTRGRGARPVSGCVGPPVAGVTRVEIDGCLTLYSPVGREVVALNATASDVWRLSDGSRTLDELVAELAEAYACAPHEIAEPVAQVVEGLRARRCLV